MKESPAAISSAAHLYAVLGRRDYRGLGRDRGLKMLVACRFRRDDGRASSLHLRSFFETPRFIRARWAPIRGSV